MNNVRISRIDLQNYRQYEKQTVTFSLDSDKNINIIIGQNGYGKSNLFNAITWCLFGREFHFANNNARRLSNIRTGAIDNAKDNESIEMSVAVWLDTENGIKQIKRKVKATVINKTVIHTDESFIVLEQIHNSNWETNADPKSVISSIVPEDIAEFFFIDGERLRQTFENVESVTIQKSIFQISQLDLLKKVFDHLDNVREKLRREIDEKSGRITEMLDQEQTLKNRRNALNVELTSREEEIKDAKKNREILDMELMDMKEGVVAEKAKRRKELYDAIAEKEKDLLDKNSDFFSFLILKAPMIFSISNLELARKYFKEMKSQHKLPPKIEKGFLTELIAGGKCICGTALDSNSNSRKSLEELLKDTQVTEFSEACISINCSIEQIYIDCVNFSNLCCSYEDSIASMERYLDERQKELKIIENELDGIDSERIAAKNTERRKYDEAITEANQEIGRIKNELESVDTEIKEIDTRIKKTLEKDKKNEELNSRVIQCESLMDESEHIITKVMKEIKDDTEKKTEEYYAKLVSEKRGGKVRISDDYELSVVFDNHDSALSLSAAETLCLGYSFMAALRYSSGFSVPVIIDTPLAKIDIMYRKNVAEWLKDALPGAQVFLLVTDSEYTTDFKNEISTKVINSFKLKYNDESRSTEVTNERN